MTARRTSAVRRRRVGAAAALACAGAAAVSGVVLASPAHAAANGLFLYTEGSTGTIVPMAFPEEEKCFDVFKGKEAKNLTTSDVILFKDGLCSEVLHQAGPGRDAEPDVQLLRVHSRGRDGRAAGVLGTCRSTPPAE